MMRIINIIIFLSLYKFVYCDVVPENSHPVVKNSSIVNINEFPDFIFFGKIYHPISDSAFNVFQIFNKATLSIGYKFNSLKIIAIKKSLIEGKNLKRINWDKMPHLKCDSHVSCYGGYLPMNDPIFKICEEYKIIQMTDSSFVVFKCKETNFGVDGRPLSIKNYLFNGKKIVLIRSFLFRNENVSMFSKSYLFDFLIAWFRTITIETILLFLLLRKVSLSRHRIILIGIMLSTMTLPLVWFVFPLFLNPYLIYVLASELIVLLLEAWMIHQIIQISIKRAIKISFYSNLTSFTVGILLNFIAFISN